MNHPAFIICSLVAHAAARRMRLDDATFFSSAHRRRRGSLNGHVVLRTVPNGCANGRPYPTSFSHGRSCADDWMARTHRRGRGPLLAVRSRRLPLLPVGGATNHRRHGRHRLWPVHGPHVRGQWRDGHRAHRGALGAPRQRAVRRRLRDQEEVLVRPAEPHARRPHVNLYSAEYTCLWVKPAVVHGSVANRLALLRPGHDSESYRKSDSNMEMHSPRTLSHLRCETLRRAHRQSASPFRNTPHLKKPGTATHL